MIKVLMDGMIKGKNWKKKQRKSYGEQINKDM